MSKINEIVAEMQKYIEEVRNAAEARRAELDEEGLAKVNEIAERTNNAIQATIVKLEDVASKVRDEEKVNDFLDRALGKCEEAVAFTKEKIDAVEGKPRIDLEALYAEIRDSFDKIMQNENVQGAANFVKGVGEEINTFLNRPEIKDKIEKAKDVTITAAEKGLDALKNALTQDEKNDL